ncbi:hypothetical protein M5K25_014613 [Dendrobium thyrsiflorum]|uniref:Uncharacterized protein n=1 Tax=Dendrobium thyrsiflorum TaxID=117978 RepID=A0ABD0UN78_DENTH
MFDLHYRQVLDVGLGFFVKIGIGILEAAASDSLVAGSVAAESLIYHAYSQIEWLNKMNPTSPRSLNSDIAWHKNV